MGQAAWRDDVDEETINPNKQQVPIPDDSDGHRWEAGQAGKQVAAIWSGKSSPTSHLPL